MNLTSCAAVLFKLNILFLIDIIEQIPSPHLLVLGVQCSFDSPPFTMKKCRSDLLFFQCHPSSDPLYGAVREEFSMTGLLVAIHQLCEEFSPDSSLHSFFLSPPVSPPVKPLLLERLLDSALPPLSRCLSHYSLPLCTHN